MYAAIAPCNRCCQCLRGDHNWCANRAGQHEAGVYPYFVGTYGDYYYIGPTQPIFSVPDELSDQALGFVNCAMGTITEGRGANIVVELVGPANLLIEGISSLTNGVTFVEIGDIVPGRKVNSTHPQSCGETRSWDRRYTVRVCCF